MDGHQGGGQQVVHGGPGDAGLDNGVHEPARAELEEQGTEQPRDDKPVDEEHRHTKMCIRDRLADLFEGKWSPELLAQLAQIPLAEAERGAFPGCPPSSGRKRRFRLVERVQAHKEACSFLLARPSGSGIESFLRLSADGEELGALETMLGLGLSRMNTLRPAGINLVLRLVHRSLLGVGLRGLNADEMCIRDRGLWA